MEEKNDNFFFHCPLFTISEVQPQARSLRCPIKYQKNLPHLWVQLRKLKSTHGKTSRKQVEATHLAISLLAFFKSLFQMQFVFLKVEQAFKNEII